MSLLVLLAAVCGILSKATTLWQHPTPILRSRTSDLLRIQKGTDDTTGKYPYVVAILGKTKHRICTGTLIAPTWVLSAAHCTRGSYVQYGDMTIPRDNITALSQIKQQIPNPNYHAYRYLPKRDIYNDIGLMLIEEIKLDKVGQLSGLDYHTTFGYRVVYAGFGATNYSTKPTVEDQEKRLQLASGIILDCHDIQMNLFYFPRVCIAPECAVRQSAMVGDSGGPLFHDGKIVAINVGVIHHLHTSICTPVSPYIAWIEQIISH